MRVHAKVERAANTVALAIVAYGLADREHVAFIETVVKRAAAMPRAAECHPLFQQRSIGHVTEVGRHQSGYVDQDGRRRQLASKRTDLLDWIRGAYAVTVRQGRCAKSGRLSVHALHAGCEG